MSPSLKERVIAGARTIWDIIGRHDLYDRHITFADHPILNRFTNFERDYLDKAILHMPTESVVLIEIGCGTGRLLIQYIDPYSKLAKDRKIKRGEKIALAQKIQHVVGIDSSKYMIERLDANLQRYTSMEGITNGYTIENGDATQLNSVLPEILRRQNLEEHPKVFCIMLCTLGNMRKKTRITVLKEIRKAMTQSDILVVSVWNRALFKKGVHNIYGDFTGLIGEFSEENIDYKEAELETEIKYFIHWFSKEELKQLLTATGFTTVDVKPKKKDYFFIVKARAKRSFIEEPIEQNEKTQAKKKYEKE